MKSTIFPRLSGAAPSPPVLCGPSLDDYGTIMLYGEIEGNVGKEISEKLLLFSFAPYGLDYVTMIINSPGGELSDGFSIVSFMEFCPVPIRTISIGLCASMAFMVAMSGKKGERYCASNTQFLSHNFSTGRWSNYPDLVATRKMEDHIYRLMMRHYSKYTGLSDEESIRKYLLKDTDTWLTPEECLEYGIVDHILTDQEVPPVTYPGFGDKVEKPVKKAAAKKTPKKRGKT
jgi:ATP-dependent Clp protease, protease subunit